MRAVSLLLFLALFAGWMGCSVALDFDALDRGVPDTGSDSVAVECTSNEECDDGIECTQDRCGDDGHCLDSLPDNHRCGHLEMCQRQVGCVATGDECEVASDCDDNLDCTKERCDIGLCRHLAQDAWCDNADPCIVNDVCDTDSGCLPGAPLACDQVSPGQDLTCRRVVCDPSTGVCDLIVLKDGADDDSDGAFDASCGGDDCDDQDPAERPGAVETCDFKDNDCDGLTDLVAVFSPVVLTTRGPGELSRPSVATDGARLAVAWQVGSGSEADIRVVFLDAAGQAVTGQMSLSVLLGTNQGLSLPRLANDDGKVLLAFVQAQGALSSLRVVGIKADSVGEAVVLDSPSAVVESGRDICDCAIAADSQGAGGSGFAVLYCAQNDLGDREVLAATAFDLESVGPLAVTTGAFGQAELELVRTSPGHFVAAMALDEQEPAGLEVWTAELLASESGATVASTPLRLSAASDTLADPSTSPRLSLLGARIAAVWSDVATTSGGSAVEPESDVRASFLDQPDSVTALVADSYLDQRPWGAVAVEEGLGLLFGQTTASDAVLDFRRFDDQLHGIGDQAGRLAHVENGSLSVSRLVATTFGLGAAWITTTTSGDALSALVFEGCEAP